MPTSERTSTSDSCPHTSNAEIVQVVPVHNLLPGLLSGVAGMVDVIGYLSLGLFTAHITGNLVVIAALLVRGGPPNMAQVLAVPVFMAAVASVWLIAKASGRRGPALTKLLLAVHFLLLACVLVFSVIFKPAVNRHGLMAGIAAMIAVSAMGCQFALLRLAGPGAPSTAVMTGNLTSGVLALLGTLSRGEPHIEGTKQRLKKTVELLIGFCTGSIVGAAAVSWLGPWAWSLPVALAGLAMVLR
jgi:uncharacterized membrane protein YoaK (UPF0700 family)